MNDILIFGAPGAGKGTHAELLATSCNYKHISTGEMLRAEVAAGTELGMKVNTFMEQGKLVPDEVVDNIVRSQLHATPLPCILDGYPRTTRQAETLDGILARLGRRLRCVLSINVPREEIIIRLEQRAKISNRSDDKEAVILHRLYEYETQSAPLLYYYNRRGLLLDVDASGSIEQTQDNIRRVLGL